MTNNRLKLEPSPDKNHNNEGDDGIDSIRSDSLIELPVQKSSNAEFQEKTPNRQAQNDEDIGPGVLAAEPMTDDKLLKGQDAYAQEDATTLDNSFDNYIEPEKTTFSKPNVEVCLSWQNLKIEATLPSARKGCRKSVDDGPKKKLILDNLSGCVLPGQFVSILGASGAGKTTLMNLLSGRLQSKNLEVSGEIMVNGIERSQVPNFGVFSAYI